jgi:ubiquinone/menaquinone biosynthesis C-methylase UbiE
MREALDPRRGYDLIASYYEKWRWSKFWRKNEAPIILEWLESLQPGLGLDAGSGTGPYLCDAVRFHHRCIAVDISPNMLAVNKRKQRDCAKVAAVSYAQADISALPFKDKTFDWILCSRVLSHISDIRPVLHEFARVLKEGSECLISDVHPNHPYTNVEIRGREVKVAIRTYKHALESTEQAISEIPHLQLLSLDEYHLKDLHSKPGTIEFGKLYDSPNPAVFYVCRLRRNTSPNRSLQDRSVVSPQRSALSR